MHLFLSSFTPRRDNLQKSPYIAPRGQIKRQNALYMNTHATTTTTRIANFHVNRYPSIA